MIVAYVDLVRRLERSAARIALATVRELRALDGDCAASAVALGEGVMVAMGSAGYVNRAIGFTTSPFDRDTLQVIDAFFRERGRVPMLELSSWADAATVEMLGADGYTTRWFRNVLVHEPHDAGPEPSGSGAGPFEIVQVDDAERARWLETLALGNRVDGGDERTRSNGFALASASAVRSIDLLALSDGVPVGCGSIQIDDDIAWLGGAATLPEWRGRGVQTALLAARLALVRTLDVGFAAATVEPSNVSARNLRRAGFTHVDTQAVVAPRH